MCPEAKEELTYMTYCKSFRMNTGKVRIELNGTYRDEEVRDSLLVFQP
jgi:hypothetical protein